MVALMYSYTFVCDIFLQKQETFTHWFLHLLINSLAHPIKVPELASANSKMFVVYMFNHILQCQNNYTQYLLMHMI